MIRKAFSESEKQDLDKMKLYLSNPKNFLGRVSHDGKRIQKDQKTFIWTNKKLGNKAMSFELRHWGSDVMNRKGQFYNYGYSLIFQNVSDLIITNHENM